MESMWHTATLQSIPLIVSLLEEQIIFVLAVEVGTGDSQAAVMKYHLSEYSNFYSYVLFCNFKLFQEI